jgi:glycosyltransferase involved in cell wall biosynthesis
VTFATPKATILIVTYNHEAFIEKAIDSALSQRCGFAFDLLIADDGSTDGTRAILERYRASGDPRLRFFLPEQRLGNYGNRLFIAALAECRGDYMAWLDGDDYWTDDAKLQTMVDALDRNPEWSAAFHPVDVVRSGSDTPAPLAAPPAKKRAYGFEDLLWSNFIPSSAVVYRRSSIPPLEPYAGVLTLDWVMHLFGARNGGIGYVDRIMGVYRVHDAGVWSGLPRLERMEEITAFQDRIPELFGYDTRRYRNRMARAWADLAVAERAVHRRDEARDAARHALRNARFSTRVLLMLAVAFTFPSPFLDLFRRITGGIGRRVRRWSAA